ncbi:hypothetical protein [Paraburkholderia diazotrophica]|uniref:hypothetical protein n=1 Tax=Paraburkholderia diazotrophica TaxID=667676 RepID=UPI0031722C43
MACVLALYAADVSAVQSRPESTIVVLPLESLTGVSAKHATQVYAPKPMPARTARHKRRAGHKTGARRRPEMYYRWSTEQLMLGGVNPSGIGTEAAGASQRPATDSAARARQKPRPLHRSS